MNIVRHSRSIFRSQRRLPQAGAAPVNHVSNYKAPESKQKKADEFHASTVTQWRTQGLDSRALTVPQMLSSCRSFGVDSFFGWFSVSIIVHSEYSYRTKTVRYAILEQSDFQNWKAEYLRTCTCVLVGFRKCFHGENSMYAYDVYVWDVGRRTSFSLVDGGGEGGKG